MFGVIGRMLGSPKQLGKLVDAGVSALDKLKYTAEEKAEDAAKAEAAQVGARIQLADATVEFMKATQPQNLTRRVLALGIGGTWLFTVVLSATLQVAAIWVDPATAGSMRQSSMLIDQQMADIDQYMMVILVFYFGAPHAQGVIETIVNRKTRRR